MKTNLPVCMGCGIEVRSINVSSFGVSATSENFRLNLSSGVFVRFR